MSLKVSIGQGTRGVIVEKDRKKEKKVRLCSTPPLTILHFCLFLNLEWFCGLIAAGHKLVYMNIMKRLVSRSGGAGQRETCGR